MSSEKAEFLWPVSHYGVQEGKRKHKSRGKSHCFSAAVMLTGIRLFLVHYSQPAFRCQ